MKGFAGFLLFVVGVSLVGRLVEPSSALAMERATSNLARTETALQTVVGSTASKAQFIEQHVESGDRTVLPPALQEFALASQRLAGLREHLTGDLAAYNDARAKKLDEFDKQLASIHDAGTQRAMEQLRRQVEEQSTERAALARSALLGVEAAIAQGADLQHAARCVMLADEFHVQGQELDTQVRQARAQAVRYQAVTADLLSHITNALTN